MATKKEISKLIERLNWIERDKASYLLAERIYNSGLPYYNDFPCSAESAHNAYKEACHRTSELQIVLDILGVELSHDYGRYESNYDTCLKYEIYDVWSIED